MAISWLVVLKSVPWSDVISNAPKLADGAKKLWNAVSGSPAQQELPASEATPAATPEAQALAGLETRVAALEAEVSDLHGQMLASSELIKALAEQNTQLIARIEVNRVRTLWLAAATAVLALVALTALVLALQHGA